MLPKGHFDFERLDAFTVAVQVARWVRGVRWCRPPDPMSEYQGGRHVRVLPGVQLVSPDGIYAALAQVRPSATIRKAKGSGSDFAMLASRASHAA